MKKIVFLILGIFIIFSSCNVSQQYLKKGQYDLAADNAIRKLSRNRNNTKQLEILKEAYPEAIKSDMEKIKIIQEEGKPDRWEAILQIYTKLYERQKRVELLYPLYLNSKEIKFEHHDFLKQINIAKTKAADYYYYHAKKLLNTNDKFAARTAFEELNKAKKYAPGIYSDIDNLINEAYYKGLTYVLLEVVNSSRSKLPTDFLINLIDFNPSDFNSKWINYFTQKQANTTRNDYDIHIDIVITDIIIGPNEREIKERTETKKIRDGWEYKVDANGHQILDSTGNPIKVPKYRIISCKVKDYRQYKTSHIQGVINYIDVTQGKTLISVPIAADHTFENFYSRADGNMNALSNATRAKLKKNPVIYPSDEEMLYALGNTLKDVIYKALQDNKDFLIQNY